MDELEIETDEFKMKFEGLDFEGDLIIKIDEDRKKTTEEIAIFYLSKSDIVLMRDYLNQKLNEL